MSALRKTNKPKDDYEKSREQEAAQNRGAKIPFYAKAAGKELLKPRGSSGKR